MSATSSSCWTLLSLRPTWIHRIEDGFTRLLAPGLRGRVDMDSLFAGIERLTSATAPSEAAPRLAQAPAQLRAVS